MTKTKRAVQCVDDVERVSNGGSTGKVSTGASANKSRPGASTSSGLWLRGPGRPGRTLHRPCEDILSEVKDEILSVQ